MALFGCLLAPVAQLGGPGRGEISAGSRVKALVKLACLALSFRLHRVYEAARTVKIISRRESPDAAHQADAYRTAFVLLRMAMF